MRLRNIAKALEGAQLGYSIKGIYVQNHPILWNNTLRVDTLVNTELWENVLHELSVKSLFGLFFNLDKRNWHLFFNSLRDWAKAPLKSIKPKRLQSLKQAEFDAKPRREYYRLIKPHRSLKKNNIPVYWVNSFNNLPRATSPKLLSKFKKTFTPNNYVDNVGRILSEKMFNQKLMPGGYK